MTNMLDVDIDCSAAFAAPPHTCGMVATRNLPALGLPSGGHTDSVSRHHSGDRDSPLACHFSRIERQGAIALGNAT